MKRIPLNHKTRPEVIAEGYFTPGDIRITHKRSNREIEPMFEEQIETLWARTKRNAKIMGKTCYDGTLYRLNDLKISAPETDGKIANKIAKVNIIETSENQKAEPRERVCNWSLAPSNTKRLRLYNI